MNNEPYDYAAAMDGFLNPEKIKKQASVNAVEQALSSLNKAAELLDMMGAFGASEVVTKVIEHIPTVVKSGSMSGGMHDDDQQRSFLRAILSKTMAALAELKPRQTDRPIQLPVNQRQVDGFIETVGALESRLAEDENAVAGDNFKVIADQTLGLMKNVYTLIDDLAGRPGLPDALYAFTAFCEELMAAAVEANDYKTNEYDYMIDLMMEDKQFDELQESPKTPYDETSEELGQQRHKEHMMDDEDEYDLRSAYASALGSF